MTAADAGVPIVRKTAASDDARYRRIGSASSVLWCVSFGYENATNAD
jgi:hypothetical protein